MSGPWSVRLSIVALLLVAGGRGVAWAVEPDAAWWAPVAASGTQAPGSYAHVAIYDAPFDRMIVFGGAVGRNDVRELSFSGTPTWALLAPAGPLPSGRIDHAAIHDPGRERMVVFGGFDGARRNDVWELSLTAATAWTQLFPTGMPPSERSDHVAIYDAAHDRMIVFGGLQATGYVNDVWELSFSGSPTWTQLAPLGTPPVARGGHCAIWDPLRSRMLVFGGVGGGAYRNDVWALSLTGTPQWTQLTPSGTPPAGRYAATTLYDPVRDRMIVFGGTYRVGFDNVPLDDVWALSLDGAPEWTELAPAGIIPAGRWNHTAVYDSARDRMVVFAGEDPTIFHDTWTLTWGKPSVGVGDREIAGVRFAPPRPNPSRGALWLNFDLPSAGRVRIEVFDARGRRVSRVLDEWLPAGRHVEKWGGTAALDEPLSNALYFIRLEAPGVRETLKAILMR